MRVNDIKVGALIYMVGIERVFVRHLKPDGRPQDFVAGSTRELIPKIYNVLEVLSAPFALQDRERVLQEFSSEWGRVLLPPVGWQHALDVLVIVPHHCLHGLPIHAIRAEPDGNPIATELGVTYCTSATLFQRCVDRNPVRGAQLENWDLQDPATAPKPPHHCVGLGTDVCTDKHDHYQSLAASFATRFAEHEGPSIPRTELKRGCRVLHDDIQRRWSVACFVCHGYVDESAPDNSGLLIEGLPEGAIDRRLIQVSDKVSLSFRDMPFRDLPFEIGARRDSRAEILTIRELQLDISTDAELVALFGCSTGAGQILDADDVESMSFHWLKAGAVSTIANLWELDIRFISRWVPHFLDGWIERRVPKAFAWREANRAVLSERPEEPISVYAGLHLSGDWL
jgi:hypothetical protein